MPGSKGLCLGLVLGLLGLGLVLGLGLGAWV